jgi:putative ABC transport system permease protein
LILLTGAGLLIRSLLALQKVDLGFEPENVLTVDIELPRVKYPERRHCQTFFEPLLQQVRTLPGVRAAGLVSGGLDLGSGGGYVRVWTDAQPRGGPEDTRSARGMSVSPGFFEAVGYRVLRGRTFTDQDVQAGPKYAVIDENLARKYFPDIDPLGQKLNGLTIVGVVSTLRDFKTLNPTHDTFFLPSSNGYFQVTSLVVRAEGDPMRLATAIRAQVSALDKDQAVGKVETLEATLLGTLAPRRFTMILLGLFSGIALILAMVGVYGLLQYSATQQTHDIGIRMALGARGIDVLRAVLVQGLRLTFLGIALGLAGAFALTRILSSLLYGVSAADPLTFALVALLLTGVALLASYLPARRAAQIDPMVALRYE